MTQAFVRRTVTVVLVLAFVAALGFFVAHIPRTVSVFLIAAFVAFGAAPLVRQLDRRMPRALSMEMARRFTAIFRALDFQYVTLDLEGYRQGSLNEVLKLKK